MYTSIYQNSYIVLIISFILLSIICYIFGIGYSTQIQNGKIVRKFSWKYPLAISLIIWLIWHFYLYPPKDGQATVQNQSEYSGEAIPQTHIMKTNKLMAQKINMVNWN